MSNPRGRIPWILPPLLFLLSFFAVPMLYLVLYAVGLSDSRGLLALLQEIATSEYHRDRVLFTYQQAFLSTLLTLALAIPLAYLFATRRIPLRGTVQALLIVPFVLPALVVALAFQSFLGADGTLGRTTSRDWINILGPVGTILLAHVFYNVGLVARLVSGHWSRVPHELLDSARNLGATRLQSFFRVLVPIGMPAILGAAALVFLFSASSFGLILILGEGHVGTLETLIAEEGTGFRPEYDLAAALGMLQLLTTLGALALYVVMERRTQSWFRPRLDAPRDPMPAWGWIVLPLALVIVLGPLLSLTLAAFRHEGTYGLAGFRLVWDAQYPLGAYGTSAVFGNSLWFGILTVLVAVPLAFALATAFRHVRARYALLETLFLAPLGSSAVLLGLGFLLTFDGQPLSDLRSSPFRIVIAHTLIAFPFASRIVAPSIDSLDPSLRAAARTLGATAGQTLFRVELPLLRPSLAAAAVFAFATSLGEFGATLLLRRPEFTTLPLAIYDALGRPGGPYRAQAEALSVLLLLVAFCSFYLLERLRGRQGRPAP